jgi:hypothetical protein
MSDRPNPYIKEIETCDHLIAYCNRLKVQHGLVLVQNTESLKEEKKNILTQLNKEDVGKKVQDGKLEKAMTKAEKEAASMVVVGGRKKGGKKQK